MHKLNIVILACVLAGGTVACGDDDGSGSAGSGGDGATGGGGGTAGGGAMGGDAGGGTGGGGSASCDEHPNVTKDGELCVIAAPQTGPMTDDLTITAADTWLLDGPVFVGDDENETVLAIEAGATVFGGDGSFLLIQRSSKIMAEGTADAPIVLTSAQLPGDRSPQDWGGLVLNGRAPINNGDANGEADGEAGTGKYGGDQPEDNSGVLKYLRVEFAGNKVDEQNELNGIAFQGVGSGTMVDYVQTHMTSDDGIEFFGGTVNVKHIVVTGSDDDSVDWTGGWSGKAQFVVAEQLEESGAEAERGIEADNLEQNNSAEPFSNPTMANFTLIGRTGNGAEGIRFRRGTKGQLWNSIVTGFEGSCVNVSEDQTDMNVGDGSLVAMNNVMNCAGGPAQDMTTAVDLLGMNSNTVEGDPMLTDWVPAAGSPAVGIGAGPTDSWFDQVDYAGAFDVDGDWADGWIETAAN